MSVISDQLKKNRNNDIVISIKNVEKIYPNVIALKDISCDIKKGEIFCLIGPNGAGKTTLVNLIIGQLKPTNGSILVKGLDPIRDRKKLFKTFGLVPQEIALYEELTGKENLNFHGRLFNMSSNDISEKVKEMLAIAGLEKRQNDRVSTYSGGMKRRLQLVRALLHDPEILILDEPTLGVDVQTRSAIHNYIIELANQGRTVVITTNYMEEAEKLGEKIIILDNKIIEGPDKLTNIQNRIFPGSIIEFKTQITKVNSEFKNDFIKNKIHGTMIFEKKLDNSNMLVGFLVKTNQVEVILEQFIIYSRAHGIPLQELTMKTPNLEDIFLKLTGKEFRD